MKRSALSIARQPMQPVFPKNMREAAEQFLVQSWTHIPIITSPYTRALNEGWTHFISEHPEYRCQWTSDRRRDKNGEPDDGYLNRDGEVKTSDATGGHDGTADKKHVFHFRLDLPDILQKKGIVPPMHYAYWVKMMIGCLSDIRRQVRPFFIAHDQLLPGCNLNSRCLGQKSEWHDVLRLNHYLERRDDSVRNDVWEQIGRSHTDKDVLTVASYEGTANCVNDPFSRLEGYAGPHRPTLNETNEAIKDQIRTQRDHDTENWQVIRPHPEYPLVFAGAMMEQLTNEQVPALFHRVQQQSSQPVQRRSIVTFLHHEDGYSKLRARTH